MKTAVLNSIAITNHARKRWVQRIATKDERKCNNQYYTLHDLIISDVQTAVENKSIYNNHSFISYIMERHGAYKYKFLVTSRGVYIARRSGDVDLIITCYSLKTCLLTHLKRGSKF